MYMTQSSGGMWAKGEPKKVVRFVLENTGSFIRPVDVRGVTPAAASKTLSELVRRGEIERVKKGLYYIPKQTLVGKSRPSPHAIARKVLEGKGRPTGLTAARMLGLTTQLTAREEVAVAATAPLKGSQGAIVHLRPRSGHDRLEPREAALLEVLRDRAKSSELDELATVERVKQFVSEFEMPKTRMRQLRDAALNEPPRVRAILGALLQSAGWSETAWNPLRRSLNALSKFEFGVFRILSNAREWQSK